MMISIENDDFVYQQEDVRAGQWEKDGLPPGTSRRCTQDDDDDDDGDDDDGGDDNDNDNDDDDDDHLGTLPTLSPLSPSTKSSSKGESS